MTPTCLDCRYGSLEAIPQPGHPCLTCEGKTVSVKVRGSNFRAMNADPDPYENTKRHAVVEVMEADDDS